MLFWSDNFLLLELPLVMLVPWFSYGLTDSEWIVIIGICISEHPPKEATEILIFQGFIYSCAGEGHFNYYKANER